MCDSTAAGATAPASDRKMLFPLGMVLATPPALHLLARCSTSPLSLILRHVSGDFGELCAEDIEANRAAVGSGGRILSSYQLNSEDPPATIWIITESDRSATTVLTPGCY